MASEVVEASGHLIDSGLLNGIFDTVIRHNASFEVMPCSAPGTSGMSGVAPVAQVEPWRQLAVQQHTAVIDPTVVVQTGAGCSSHNR